MKVVYGIKQFQLIPSRKATTSENTNFTTTKEYGVVCFRTWSNLENLLSGATRQASVSVLKIRRRCPWAGNGLRIPGYSKSILCLRMNKGGNIPVVLIVVLGMTALLQVLLGDVSGLELHKGRSI